MNINSLIKQTGFLGALLLVAVPLRAELATPASADLAAEAFPILRADYIDARKLPVKESENLNAIIAHSNGTIRLGTPEADSTSVPILTAFLPGNIIYWRLASFTPENGGWPGLAAQLSQWARQGAEGIILDLRSNIARDDYAGAAQIAGFFMPEGTVLFTARDISGNDHPYIAKHAEPSFHQPLILITNNKTVGAAEALAACLKVRGALVIGQTTQGSAAIFEEQKLSSGQFLRFIHAQVFLPDGNELWGHPVNPDIGLTINEQNEKNALALIEQHGVLDVIREAAERRRLSEASLVQGKDPELDDYLASREKKPASSIADKPAVQDVALIGALDSLKAIRLSQRWTASPLGSAPLPESPSFVQ